MSMNGSADPGAAYTLTLRARLRESLREQIVSGVWKTHEKLPSETELIDQAGVSRITVRQALADLVADGLIVRVQGKGSFVAPAPVRQELSRLQGLSEALAHQGREVRTKVLSLASASLPATAAKALGLGLGTPCTLLRTLRFADGLPLSLNNTWIEPGVGAGIDAAVLTHADLLTLYENAYQLRVARAVVDIRAGMASTEQRRYLKLDETAAVLQVDRTVLTSGDRPLHFETSIYRADAFTYRVELNR